MATSTPLTPKERISDEFRRQKQGILEGTGNPIAKELKDIERARQFAYNNYPVIPFFEEGDATLYLFEKLRNLSPTHGGIINVIKHFVLGEGCEIVRKPPRGWKLRPEMVVDTSYQEWLEFSDFLKEVGIEGGDLIDLSASLYENYKPYGNMFLELVLTETDGLKTAHLYCHDVQRVRYFATMDGEPTVVLVSKRWDDYWLTRYPPKPVPCYPNFAEDEFGAKRTMFHIKHKVADYDWYGMPDWIMALYNAFNEVQHGEYTVTEYANEFIGKIFIEYDAVGYGVEEDGEYADTGADQGFVDNIKDVFTNKGTTAKKSSVLFRARDPDAQPTTIEQIESNTNEKYHESMAAVNESQIFKAHDWHPILMLAIAGKLGMSQEYYELVKVKQKTVIGGIQADIARIINMAIEEIAIWCEKPDMALLGVGFANLFQEMQQEEEPNTQKSQPGAQPEEDEELEPDVEPEEDE